MVVCEICGAGNEEKLTFCRTCGERLGKAAAAVAAPSLDPRTLRGVSDPNTDDEPPPSRTARPSAPPLVLSKQRESKAETSATAPAATTPAARTAPDAAPSTTAPAAATPAPKAAAATAAMDAPADDRVRCEQCNAASPKDYRFCVGCGAVLPRRRDVQPAALASSMMRRRQSSRPPGIVADTLSDSKPIAKPAVRVEAPADPKPAARVEAKPAPKVAAPSEPPAAPQKAASNVPPSEPVELAMPYEQPMPQTRAAASPAKAAKPVDEVTGRLVVIVEDGSEGTTIELRGRQMDIGSSEGDIILEEDRYLSPRHARLFRQNDAWYLRDLDSLNGIYRRLRKPAELYDGDHILLGLEVLRFDTVDHAERGLGHAMENGVLLFGSPATPRRARLSQRTVEGIARDVYHLTSDETTIGREMGDIVFTGDPFMSRRHAMVTWDESHQTFVLTDLSSSNGTYLAIRDDVRLENGDFIRLGQHLFRVDLTSNAAGNR